MKLLDKFAVNVRKFPDMVLFADELENAAVTNAQLDEISGRVYAYLKQHGIGKEDPVLVCLPRCVRYIGAMVGILKAGAVLVPLEEGFPEERLAFIRSDCKPRLVIDNDVWQEMMQTRPLPGYEARSAHDAAYIIYTSGSTGNPKGVVHELGSIDRMLDNLDLCLVEWFGALDEEAFALACASERSLCVTPFYFLAALLCQLDCLYQSCFMYIITYESYKNVETFKRILLEQKITTTFLTPSYVSIADDIKTPYLQYVVVGAERVTNLYNENVRFCNGYGMTEAGLDICTFTIDQPYENTPVGKPYANLHLALYDEDDNEVPTGEVGEITLESVYCRGYLNQPEQTAAVFRGGRYYTGDMGRFLPDGNLLVLGRKDDMIKILGNRVEPAEIEAAVKDVLGVKWAYVQAFRQDGRSFVCAYYVDDIQVDPDAVIEKLSQRLPAYMIPIYYLKIEEIPRTASGKVDRSAFRAPDTDQYRVPYAAPRTAVEKALCKAFAAVLEQKRVGIRDDFYELGGDSMAAIAILSECDLPGLDVIRIFRYRTVEKIAANYAETCLSEQADLSVRNAEALKQSWPLLPHQDFFFKMQMQQPDTLEYNLYALVKLSPLVTPRRLRRAVTKVLHSHPAYFTGLYRDENGNVRQRYMPELEKKIEIERISEKKLMQIKDTLPHAFPMLDSRLYDCRIFATPAGTYMFLDVHHLISDGTSLRIFMKGVRDAYWGRALKPDYYYIVLADHAAVMQSPAYLQAKEYLQRTYGEVTSPHMGRDSIGTDGVEEQPMIPLDVDSDRLKRFLRHNAVSRSEFFMGVAGLAQATSTRDAVTGFGWTYSGRDQAIRQNVCACLITQLLSTCRLHRYTTVGRYFSELREQSRRNMENSFYPFAFDILPRFTDVMTYIYQSNLFDFGKEKRMFRFVEMDVTRHATDSYMQVDILDDSNGITLFMNYNTAYFDPAYVEIYAAHFKKITAALLALEDCEETRLSAVLQEFDFDRWVKD